MNTIKLKNSTSDALTKRQIGVIFNFSRVVDTNVLLNIVTAFPEVSIAEFYSEREARVKHLGDDFFGNEELKLYITGIENATLKLEMPAEKFKLIFK